MLWLFFNISLLMASEKIAFMMETPSGEKTLWIQENKPEKINTHHSINIYPFLSKNGKELAYVGGESEKELNVYIKNLNDSSNLKITKAPAFVLHPHISGNGDYIAYSTNEGNSSEPTKNHIVIYNRKLQSEVRLEDQNSLYFPKISSNGSFLVYQKTISQKIKQIWKHDLINNTSEFLSNEFEKCMAPSLSFDDSMLVMTCFKDNAWNIHVMNIPKKITQQITFTPQESFSPTFDNQNNIIFASLENDLFELQKIHLNNKSNTYEKPEMLIRMAGNLYAPSISGNLNYNIEYPTMVPNPPRSSFGAIHHNNKIYLMGGHQGKEHTYPPESFLNQIDIYDLKNKTWSKGTPRPVLSHGYGVEACGDSIYAFGGFAYSADHKPKWKSLSQIDKYDTQKNTWSTIGHLKKPRSSNVVSKVGNKIYIIGGWNSTPNFEGDKDGEFHDTIEIFNCKTESIEPLTVPMPNPLRRAFTGVVQNGKILLLGGIGAGASHFSLINNVTEFDPETRTFKERPPLPFPTFAPASGIIQGKLHLFGGMFKISETTYEYVNHTYSLSNEVWNHTGRYLKDSKGFSSVVPVKNALWIIGGHSYDNNTDAPVYTIEAWK